VNTRERSPLNRPAGIIFPNGNRGTRRKQAKKNLSSLALSLLLPVIGKEGPVPAVRYAKLARGWLTAQLIYEGMPERLWVPLIEGMGRASSPTSAEIVEDIRLGWGAAYLAHFCIPTTPCGMWVKNVTRFCLYTFDITLSHPDYGLSVSLDPVTGRARSAKFFIPEDEK
jgi:hypothetical protein